MIYQELVNIVGELPTQFDPLYLVSCFIVIMFFITMFKLLFCIFEK